MTFTGTIPDLGILVGYDGSPGGERALAWAARTADDADTPLYIAMAIPRGVRATEGTRCPCTRPPGTWWRRPRPHGAQHVSAPGRGNNPLRRAGR
ncbi:universal stress protein [Embleya sp. NPDC055664]